MKLVSWNVAGFRACLKKGFPEFFNKVDADIVCLQEVKATKDQYDFHPENYEEFLYPAEKKGYAGTLIYSRIKPLSVKFGIGIEKFDREGRSITLEFDDFFLINFYVPNVKRTLERMDERMEWEDYIRMYLKELDSIKPVVACGDFNVAHTELDIKNAKQNIGNAGFTYEERNKFTELLESGFIDTYRHYHKDERDAYTWWSYITNCRERNIGWRIDYFIVSKRFIDKVTNTSIYNEILGSDHCPIGIEISQ
ncbi:MAG: exodeoxyribonuclease III [Bacilli bacterium]|nr:exodeoxyribonuclease III [Bacilli bacterium]